MNTTQEKIKTVKKTSENIKNEKVPEVNRPEEKEFPWQLSFIIAAFGVGMLLLILKIVGIL